VFLVEKRNFVSVVALSFVIVGNIDNLNDYFEYSPGKILLLVKSYLIFLLKNLNTLIIFKRN